MKIPNKNVTVIGAGLVGSLLAILLRQKGCNVAVYERRRDIRTCEERGRSINLVVTSRGLDALDMVGLKAKALEFSVAVTGRMMHSKNSQLTFQRYGRDDSECNYSISRSELNKLLITEAQRQGASFIFGKKVRAAEFDSGQLQLWEETGNRIDLQSGPVFGTDGASSVTRVGLATLPGHRESNERLGHDYKELTIPEAEGGGFRIDGNCLHIWPRGNHMLMALPNKDGSFTVTLYLPSNGDPSFASIQNRQTLADWFRAEFPDAAGLIPRLEDEFFENQVGALRTIRCFPWNFKGQMLLLGDAAHSIVPFFGQGMNAGFEDCRLLGTLIERHQGNWLEIFSKFSDMRKPDTDAIADMALDNFTEMRDRVSDGHFLLKKAVERIIEQKFPNRYRSRYAMVMYTSVPYRIAQAAGKIQAEILEILCRGIERAEDIDLNLCEELIARKLTPYLLANNVKFASL